MAENSSLKPRVTVLRIGHRVSRDKRVSTHVGLVARALGAEKIVFVGNLEHQVLNKIKEVAHRWGGIFEVGTTESCGKFVKEWKSSSLNSCIVHLTMYGENIESSDVIKRIRSTGDDLLVIVGAEKVQKDVYRLADYNVAIGNQPHSEVAALAIFLDRLYRGVELRKEFCDSEVKIIPDGRRKIIIRSGNDGGR